MEATEDALEGEGGASTQNVAEPIDSREEVASTQPDQADDGASSHGVGLSVADPEALGTERSGGGLQTVGDDEVGAEAEEQPPTKMNGAETPHESINGAAATRDRGGGDPQGGSPRGVATGEGGIADAANDGSGTNAANRDSAGDNDPGAEHTAEPGGDAVGDDWAGDAKGGARPGTHSEADNGLGSARRTLPDDSGDAKLPIRAPPALSPRPGETAGARAGTGVGSPSPLRRNESVAMSKDGSMRASHQLGREMSLSFSLVSSTHEMQKQMVAARNAEASKKVQEQWRELESWMLRFGEDGSPFNNEAEIQKKAPSPAPGNLVRDTLIGLGESAPRQPQAAAGDRPKP